MPIINLKKSESNRESKSESRSEAKKRKYPVIDRSTCAGCSVCVENCPMDCLQIELPKHRGEIRTIARLTAPEHCVGCGICAKHCPIRAIEMRE